MLPVIAPFAGISMITLKEKEFHVSDMKPSVFNAALTDPLDVCTTFVKSYLYHE